MQSLAKWTRATRLPSFSLPTRLRGGRVERSIEYLRLIGVDYRQVALDVREECRQKPRKASLLAALSALIGYCLVTNPNEHQFRQQLLEASNELWCVSETVRNRVSCEHVLHVSRTINERLLRYQSLALFSVVYLADYSPECCVFGAQCQYLRPKLTSYVSDRIVDIGFAGKYRLLDRVMNDYDINCDEWTAK